MGSRRTRSGSAKVCAAADLWVEMRPVGRRLRVYAEYDYLIKASVSGNSAIDSGTGQSRP